MIAPSGLVLSAMTAVDETAVSSEVRSLGLALAWTGLVVAAGALGILLELTAIILRFLNFGYINVKINYFLATVSVEELNYRAYR